MQRSIALRAAAEELHLLRHHALLVASEEALEQSHRDTVDGRVPAVAFDAIERALAEAKAKDAALREVLALIGEAPVAGGE
jgi:hypothetical protein